MRRRERAQESGLPFEIPPVDAGGGGVSAAGSGTERSVARVAVSGERGVWARVIAGG